VVCSVLPLVEGADGGDELCSPILPFVDPADGGDELCSVAPPEVSALPDGGVVADLDASGDVVLAAGGCVDVSAAKTGAIPMESAIAVNARRRVISSSFLCLIRITWTPNASKWVCFHGAGLFCSPCAWSFRDQVRSPFVCSPSSSHATSFALVW
jgi:hypothetical protein